MMGVHETYMQRCLDLAALAIGETSPNPMVGAVVVYNDHIIGEGYHHRCGEPHAEVNAIASVKDLSLLKDSTLYVSLEPCNHVGKTPACTDLILRVGIPRVVVAVQDPFPKVNGSGIERLRSAGVEVITGVLQQEAAHQNRRFFTYHCAKRPYIILKWAQSADGFLDAKRSATVGIGENNPDGPVRISNEWTRYWLHRWRSEEDAIMVGTQTALLDNPTLTVRAWEGRNPVRIVPDRTLKLPSGLNLFEDASALTWLITDQHLVQQASDKFAGYGHVRVFGMDYTQANDPEVGLIAQWMHLLYEQGIQSLLVEGGAQLLQSFLEAGAWDEIRIFESRKTLHQLQHAMNESCIPAADLEVAGVSAPRIPQGLIPDISTIGDNELRVYYNTVFNSSNCSMQ